jgi:hypothetical protein
MLSPGVSRDKIFARAAIPTVFVETLPMAKAEQSVRQLQAFAATEVATNAYSLRTGARFTRKIGNPAKNSI